MELHNLYCSLNIIRIIQSWTVRSRGKKYIQDISFKPEGKKPLERPSLRCEGNIRIGFKEVECGVRIGSG
jgi:hypothetical protein